MGGQRVQDIVFQYFILIASSRLINYDHENFGMIAILETKVNFRCGYTNEAAN